jgi:chromosome segregation ATPase
MDREDLADRLAAVERSLTEGDVDHSPVADDAAVVARLDELEDRAAALDERLAEVESAVQALRGYVGGVESVNEDVERRANAAVARVERLEDRLDGRPERAAEPGTSEPGTSEPDAADRVAAAARETDGGFTGGSSGSEETDPDRGLPARLRDVLS